jgi:streptogramin lyase
MKKLLSALVVSVALTLPATADAGVTEFATPTPGADVYGIAAGPDGNVWFTELTPSKVARVTPAGLVTEFPLPADRGPKGIVAGPDGNLWVAEVGGAAIAKVSPQGTVLGEYSTGGGGPSYLAVGADGALWFTLIVGDGVGKVTPGGTVTTYFGSASATSGPLGITAGPDGNLWFSEYGGAAVGRATTAGVVTEFATGVTPGQGGQQIAAGPDGRLWWAESSRGALGRVSTGGTVSELDVAAAGYTEPTGVVTHTDGLLYFVDFNASAIARVRDGDRIEPVYDLAAHSGPAAVATGPDGNLWVAQTAGGHIARVVPPMPPEKIAAPALIGVPVPGSTLTCTGGFYTNTPNTTLIWQRAPRATTSETDGWAKIDGASGARYVVQDVDVGSRVRCLETAVNADGSIDVPSGSLRVDIGIPQNTTAPEVVGRPVAGEKLTCSTGEWTGNPDLTVQWIRAAVFTTQEIRLLGETSAEWTATRGIFPNDVLCEVTARNDVGGPVVVRSATLHYYEAPPRIEFGLPRVILDSTGPGVLDKVARCDPGRWNDVANQSYSYQWLRDGQVIGIAGDRFTITVDDLGRNLQCVVTASNPVGTSDPATSPPTTVPLPSGSNSGTIYSGGGYNEFAQVNLAAMPAAVVLALRRQAVAQVNKDLRNRFSQCTATAKHSDFPRFDKRLASRLSEAETCAVLIYDPDHVTAREDGVFWTAGICRPRYDGDLSFAGPRAVLRAGVQPVLGTTDCPLLSIAITRLDVKRPPPLDAQTSRIIAAERPEQVLWDVDGDGHVDAVCGQDAPMLSAYYDPGEYTVKAVFVNAAGRASGSFETGDFQLQVSKSDTSRGKVRPGQGFACSESVDPPQERAQPCTDSATFGRVHVSGSLCPVSLAQIPEVEIEYLKASQPKVYAVLKAQFDYQKEHPTPIRKRAVLRSAGLRIDRSLDTSAAIARNAVATLADPVARVTPASVRNELVKQVGKAAAQKSGFALDQIYVINGDANINGITEKPTGDHSILMVPTDAGEVFKTVQRMSIASGGVKQVLDNTPVAAGAFIKTLVDRPDFKPSTFLDGNFDAEALQKLAAEKVNLGPFRLAGSFDVKLDDNGGATLHGWAELPILKTTPDGPPVRAEIFLHVDPHGHFTFDGFKFESLGEQYLFGIKVSDLRLSYLDGALDLTGKLRLPPAADYGIDIDRLRISGGTKLEALHVNFIAPPGTGLPLGNGLFVTELGGGYENNADDIYLDTAVSYGLATNGKCEIAKVRANLHVHFRPSPFFFEGDGTPSVACVEIGKGHFYAGEDGHVAVGGQVRIDAGPTYVEGGASGEIDGKKWQIDAHGEGGFSVAGADFETDEMKGLIGSSGVAVCGGYGPFKGGAGLHFPGGDLPTSVGELIANLDLFLGCNLSDFSPFGRDVRAAQAAGSRSFTLPPGATDVAVKVTGTNGVPQVGLRDPDGHEYDLRPAVKLSRIADGIQAGTEPGRDRLELFLRNRPGTWTLLPAPGSPPIATLEHADVLPAPRVKASVVGVGSSRVLRYDVTPIDGQVVRFVEQAKGGGQDLKTVTRGGRGTLRFTTAEATSTTRTILAEVVQDGIPRDNLTVAHFRAASPAVGRATHVRIKRAGTRAILTWHPAALAGRYEIVVRTGDGARRLVSRGARARRVIVTGLTKGEGATASVVGLSPAGRRGRAVQARLAGTLTLPARSFKKAPARRKRAAPKKRG